MGRIGNGMILAGLIGLTSVGAPTNWMMLMMGGAFLIGFIFPALQ